MKWLLTESGHLPEKSTKINKPSAGWTDQLHVQNKITSSVKIRQIETQLFDFFHMQQVSEKAQ